MITINLSGYSIVSTGGTIIAQSGFSLIGAVIKSGTAIKGIYPSINAALSAATWGQTVEVTSGSQTITDNLSVQNGITLTVNPGATLTFSAGKKNSVYGGGTFSASGATFQGNGTAGSWNSISYYANSNGSIQYSTIKDAQCGIYATTGANVTVSNNTITNNSLYGLSLIQNSNASVSNCTVSNNGTGINLSSSNVPLTGNNIISNTNYGINANNISYNLYWHSNNLHGNGYAMLLNNASPWIGHCDISDNAHGVVITSSATSFAVVPSIDERMRGYNAITCATTPLFKAENYSTVYAGYGYDGGYNSIFGSDLPDMEAYNYSGIYACNNYWGSPYPAVNTDGTSWILSWYPLSSDPNPGSCDALLESTYSGSVSNLVESDNANTYWQAITYGLEGKLPEAKELLEIIIDGDFDSVYSPLALLAYYELSLNRQDKNIDLESLQNDFAEVLIDIYKQEKGEMLKPYAIRLLARESALIGDYKNMVAYNTELVNDFPNSINELSALYDLIIYYAEVEEDIAKAKEFLSRMNEVYPEEDLTLFANINMSQFAGNLKKEALTNQIPVEYSLSNNFPNPFNPVTTITYTIPVNERVLIKVYDILGREVTTLVNEDKIAGKYSLSFDASRLASGIYFYTIKAGSFTQTKKMVLIK